MSLEKIDRYISELEAIKYYEQVKRERDEARQESSRLTQENESLKQKITELESLKNATEGKTLAKAERIILAEKNVEINRRASERFNSFKEEWERRDKPKEVSRGAVSQLSTIISTISTIASSGPKYFLSEAVEVGLPQSVRKILEDEVARRTDEEFARRVEQKSNERAHLKLEALKNIEWPSFLQANVTPRAELLASKFQNNAIAALSGDWTLWCDKCGQSQTKRLTPEEITSLLQQGQVRVACANPECKDLVFRHGFTVTLTSMIGNYLTTGQ